MESCLIWLRSTRCHAGSNCGSERPVSPDIRLKSLNRLNSISSRCGSITLRLTCNINIKEQTRTRHKESTLVCVREIFSTMEQGEVVTTTQRLHVAWCMRSTWSKPRPCESIWITRGHELFFNEMENVCFCRQCADVIF